MELLEAEAALLEPPPGCIPTLEPPADHFLAILGALLPKWWLFFVTLEQGGLRISEAASLRWADVDVAKVPHYSPTTSGTVASRSGTNRVYQLGSLRSARVTLGRPMSLDV